MPEDFLTMQEAAKRARVTFQSLYRAVSESRLQSTTLYGKKLVRPSDLETYIENVGQRNGQRTKNGETPPVRKRR